MPVPVATITSRGKTLDPEIHLVSLEVRREVNRIPEARLIFADGKISERRFDLSNSTFFAPGNPIEIALRREGDTRDVTVFEGLVVRHAIEARSDRPVLRIELKDRAFKLTRVRKSAAFRQWSDQDVIQKLICDAGLTAGELATTPVKHGELIQYQASDWDFIVSRADVQGLLVDVDRGKVSVRRPMLAAKADLQLEFGLCDKVLEIDLEIDGAHQPVEMKCVGWDIAGQTLTAAEQASEPKVPVGNLDATAIARELGGGEQTFIHAAPLELAELKAWADARLVRSRFSMLRGHAVVDGNAAIAPLATAAIGGIGDRFDGKALVSSVTQRLDDDGWRTELTFGLPPEWFAGEPDISVPPAAGLLPAIHDLHVATVAPFEEDPLGEHRIKIRLPALPDSYGAIWARVAGPDAGSRRGIVFWPQPEDEVIVGFLDGDPRQAIVLGALYSSAHSPHEFVGPPSNESSKSAIVTKNGSLIGFDDAGGTITVRTPSKNKIVLDDQAGEITVEDQHGNILVMNGQKVRLESAGALELVAVDAVTIKGKSVDVQ